MTAVVSGGGETNTSNDTASDPTTIDPPGVGTSFVTAYALNSPALRNNYSGWVGMQFTVGSTALTVSSIGRDLHRGQFGVHAVKLVNASTGLGRAERIGVAEHGRMHSGQFKYGSLGSLTLQANTAYYLVSRKSAEPTNGTTTGRSRTTSVAAVNGSIYSNGTGWSTINTPNTSYVPVNFIYATAAPPPPPPPGPADLTIGVTHSGNFIARGRRRYLHDHRKQFGRECDQRARIGELSRCPTGLIATGIVGGGWTCTQARGTVLAQRRSGCRGELSVAHADGGRRQHRSSAERDNDGRCVWRRGNQYEPTTRPTIRPLWILRRRNRLRDQLRDRLRVEWSADPERLQRLGGDEVHRWIRFLEL